MKKTISLALAILILFSGLGLVEAAGLDTVMKSYLIGDYETGEIIKGNKIDEVVAIASISKLMSYMVVMDSNIPLDKKILIDRDTQSIGGSIMKLEEGKEYTVDELLDYGLIVSSNNAIYALAKAVSKTEAEFVKRMNRKAREIGLETAEFFNSTGLPIKGMDKENQMSARDLFKMSRYIINHYPILERTKTREIQGLNFFYEETSLENTNPSLVIPEVDGLKTGRTGRAGYCLISSLEKEDFRVIGVFMGARSEKLREDYTVETMLDLRDNYSREEILNKEEALDTIKIGKSNRLGVDIFPYEDFSKIVDNNLELEVVVDLDEEFDLPIEPGDSMGSVRVFYDNEEVFSTKLVTDKKVKKANIITRFFLKLIGPLMNIF